MGATIPSPTKDHQGSVTKVSVIKPVCWILRGNALTLPSPALSHQKRRRHEDAEPFPSTLPLDDFFPSFCVPWSTYENPFFKYFLEINHHTFTSEPTSLLLGTSTRQYVWRWTAKPVLLHPSAKAGPGDTDLQHRILADKPNPTTSHSAHQVTSG